MVRSLGDYVEEHCPLSFPFLIIASLRYSSAIHFLQTLLKWYNSVCSECEFWCPSAFITCVLSFSAHCAYLYWASIWYSTWGDERRNRILLSFANSNKAFSMFLLCSFLGRLSVCMCVCMHVCVSVCVYVSTTQPDWTKLPIVHFCIVFITSLAYLRISFTCNSVKNRRERFLGNKLNGKAKNVQMHNKGKLIYF